MAGGSLGYIHLNLCMFLFEVQESMENLEEVVRERNRAYFELETGGSGERERVIRQGRRNISFR